MEVNNNYWDYISTLDTRESEEDIRELIKENFQFLKPYLNELFYVEANYIYLNYVFDIPQAKIAELFGVSQYGVSKRIKSALEKINNLFKRPENNRNIVRQDFKNLLPNYLVEIAVIYYFMKTFSITSEITGFTYGNLRNKLYDVINLLDKYSKVKTHQEFVKLYKRTKKEKNQNIYYMNSLKDKSIFELEVTKAKRYYDYLNKLIKSSNYGDYTFKRDDKKRLERLK